MSPPNSSYIYDPPLQHCPIPAPYKQIQKSHSKTKIQTTSMVFHLNNYLVSLSLLLATTTSSPIVSTKAIIPRQDGSCDPTLNGADCPAGNCCSFWGFCGKGEPWCGSIKVTCDPHNHPQCPSGMCCSQAGLCGNGPEYCPVPPGPGCGSGPECPAGLCCSKWGFCGTGPEYCPVPNGCGSGPDFVARSGDSVVF